MLCRSATPPFSSHLPDLACLCISRHVQHEDGPGAVVFIGQMFHYDQSRVIHDSLVYTDFILYSGGFVVG